MASCYIDFSNLFRQAPAVLECLHTQSLGNVLVASLELRYLTFGQGLHTYAWQVLTQRSWQFLAEAFWLRLRRLRIRDERDQQKQPLVTLDWSGLGHLNPHSSRLISNAAKAAALTAHVSQLVFINLSDTTVEPATIQQQVLAKWPLLETLFLKSSELHVISLGHLLLQFCQAGQVHF